jgi:hypothetical protein
MSAGTSAALRLRHALFKYGVAIVATGVAVAGVVYAVARLTASDPVPSVFESTATIVFSRSTEQALAESLLPGSHKVAVSADAYASAIASAPFLSEVAGLAGLTVGELSSGRLLPRPRSTAIRCTLLMFHRRPRSTRLAVRPYRPAMPIWRLSWLCSPGPPLHTG